MGRTSGSGLVHSCQTVRSARCRYERTSLAAMCSLHHVSRRKIACASRRQRDDGMLSKDLDRFSQSSWTRCCQNSVVCSSTIVMCGPTPVLTKRAVAEVHAQLLVVGRERRGVEMLQPISDLTLANEPRRLLHMLGQRAVRRKFGLVLLHELERAMTQNLGQLRLDDRYVAESCDPADLA